MADEPVSLVQAVKPSTSTTAAAGAGAVTALIIWAFNEFANIEMTPEAASGLTVLIGLIAGYFFSGGRSETSL